jgi:hypothetical protein
MSTTKKRTYTKRNAKLTSSSESLTLALSTTSPIASQNQSLTIPSSTILIEFDKPSFYAKINAFLTSVDDVNNMSSASILIKGGTTDGSDPTKEIQLLETIASVENESIFWQEKLIKTNLDNKCSIAIPIINNTSSSLTVSIRVELIQTNTNIDKEPSLNSITVGTYSS